MGVVVAQSQGISMQAHLAPMAAVIAGTGTDHATLASRLSALAASVHATATQQLGSTSALARIGSSIHVQSLNVNTAVIVASLPRLRSSASNAATASARASGALPASLAASASGSQAARASASLPRFWAFVSLGAQSYEHITATLGPIAALAAVQPPPSGYAADGNYYAALPARPFYASLDARQFYAAIDSRSFYALSDPDVTPTFDSLDPRETVTLTLDASNDLAAGETLVSIGQVVAVQQAGAPGTLPTLTGQLVNTQPLNLTVNGKAVTIAAGHAMQVIVTGGVSGCRYLVAATCTTSNPDKVLVLKGILPVSAN